VEGGGQKGKDLWWTACDDGRLGIRFSSRARPANLIERMQETGSKVVRIEEAQTVEKEKGCPKIEGGQNLPSPWDSNRGGSRSEKKLVMGKRGRKFLRILIRKEGEAIHGIHSVISGGDNRGPRGKILKTRQICSGALKLDRHDLFRRKFERRGP